MNPIKVFSRVWPSWLKIVGCSLIFCSALLCAQAPSSLKKKSLAFFVEEGNLEGHKEGELLGLMSFFKNGTYEYKTKNEKIAGDYSFHVLKNRQKAHVVFTYSRRMGTYFFHLDLHFDQQDSGQWKWLQKEAFFSSGYQSGIFREVSPEEAHELIQSF